MILFDLNVSQVAIEASRDIVQNYKYAPVFLKSYSTVSKSFESAYLIKNPEFLTVSNQNLAKKKFVKQSQWKKTFNKLWHQTIFLSVPSKSYDKYVADLSYINAYKSQNTGKHLIAEFSRSLLKGSVTSSLSKQSNSWPSRISSIQHIWPKNFKEKQRRIVELLHSSSHSSYLEYVKEYLDDTTSFSHFPLFTVSNYLDQMIISEPPGKLGNCKTVLGQMSTSNSRSIMYCGWFFTNFKDAREYMNSISRQYNLKQNHLKIFACNFNTFYETIDKFGDKVNFKLIPDLEEVSNLTKTYRHYSNVSFHENQKYSSKYFQGQPLYMFKLNSRDKELTIGDNVPGLEYYSPIFTSYQTARKFLNKKIDDSLSAKNKKMLDIVVYNLESLIKDEALNRRDRKHPFLLVPSESAYRFTKKYCLKKKLGSLQSSLSSCMFSVQLWSKRILWSLTSRQPNGWQ